jgi:hypothetical protein
MQLTFTADEFRLLLDLLLERERQSHLSRRSGDHILPIAQKFINHDLALALDELEDLEEFLKEAKGHVDRELESCKDPAATHEFRRRQLLLEETLDRVVEACAMA